MDYCYSKEVNKTLYDTDGLGIDVPLRLHNSWDEETKGTLQMQDEWSQHVCPASGYKGGLGPRYHFMSATIPECLPERLEVISYANEFAFLYDGMRGT